MNEKLQQEYLDLLEEVEDCESTLSNDKAYLEDVKKDVQRSQLNLARAVIALDEFKKRNAKTIAHIQRHAEETGQVQQLHDIDQD